MARNRASVRNAKMEKKQETGRVVKEKFQEENAMRIKPLRALNEKQSEYIEKIGQSDLVCATGYFGTSKTYIPTVMACHQYLKGEIDKIYLSRPNVSNSKSLGAMPGDLNSKMSNWLQPVLSTLKDQMGEVKLSLAIERGNIQFVPLEMIKGFSMNDCVCIIDEAEDLTWKEVKSVITRQGKNSKFILAGDLAQSDLGVQSGLKKLCELINKYPHLNASHIDFDKFEYIVRSQIVRDWAKIMQKEGL